MYVNLYSSMKLWGIVGRTQRRHHNISHHNVPIIPKLLSKPNNLHAISYGMLMHVYSWVIICPRIGCMVVCVRMMKRQCLARRWHAAAMHGVLGAVRCLHYAGRRLSVTESKCASVITRHCCRAKLAASPSRCGCSRCGVTAVPWHTAVVRGSTNDQVENCMVRWMCYTATCNLTGGWCSTLITACWAELTTCRHQFPYRVWHQPPRIQ